MNIETIAILILSLFCLILLILVIRLEIRQKKLLMGTKGTNLEEAINILGRYVENVKKSQVEAVQKFKEIDGRLDKSIRSIETTRFNPFEEAGGNHSFAISLLNDEGDGVVISSLYARDRMSIFAKPIKNGNSSYELTAEEAEVLEKTKK